MAISLLPPQTLAVLCLGWNRRAIGSAVDIVCPPPDGDGCLMMGSVDHCIIVSMHQHHVSLRDAMAVVCLRSVGSLLRNRKVMVQKAMVLMGGLG